MDEYLKDLYKFRQKLNGNGINPYHNDQKSAFNRETSKVHSNGYNHSDSDSECSSPDLAKRILRFKLFKLKKETIALPFMK